MSGSLKYQAQVCCKNTSDETLQEGKCQMSNVPVRWVQTELIKSEFLLWRLGLERRTVCYQVLRLRKSTLPPRFL